MRKVVSIIQNQDKAGKVGFQRCWLYSLTDQDGNYVHTFAWLDEEGRRKLKENRQRMADMDDSFSG